MVISEVLVLESCLVCPFNFAVVLADSDLGVLGLIVVVLLASFGLITFKSPL